jgi:hypothetical protein
MFLSEKDFALLRPTYQESHCNLRVKVNPRTGEVMEVLAASRDIFNPSGVVPVRTSVRRDPLPGREAWETEEASAASGDRWEQEEKSGSIRAANRAKRNVFDLAACNDFDLFITLTLNGERIDRYNYKEVIRPLQQWLDNRVRRKGLRYLLVPELHKDGALHFHGLINSEAVRLVDSGHTDRKGKKIYNLPEWTLGFTTAQYLTGDYGAVCTYVSKYVTKQAGSGGTIGGRYYFHGGKLARPFFRYGSVDFAEASEEGKVVEIEDASLSLAHLPFEKVERFFSESRNS